MAYIDGFVAAVPTANKQKYLRHARKMAPMFKEYGAERIVECWGDDIPPGKLTSFPMAVKCKKNETVLFSWIFWPSREARDAGNAAAMEDMGKEFSPEKMPFDGKRLIYGGFNPVVDL